MQAASSAAAIVIPALPLGIPLLSETAESIGEEKVKGSDRLRHRYFIALLLPTIAASLGSSSIACCLSSLGVILSWSIIALAFATTSTFIWYSAFEY